ncbi:MAG TPA: amidohydrolase family protein [Pedobacter sp.]|jgi:L-fuconolactonase
MKIDSHNHFWNFDAARHSWIDDSMKVIQRDFMPEEFNFILQKNGFDGTVVVQVDQTPKENTFLLQLAEVNSKIKGVVGWVDLGADNLGEQLEQLSGFEKLKGFRHIAQAENNDFLAQNDIIRGVQRLNNYNFTYDILINPAQLDAAIQLVSSCPDQRFVLDHIAKPYLKTGEIEQWRNDISKLSSFENVWCKVSGMVTEANWNNWKVNDFFPYLDVVFEAFGSKRLMYGSDWPVCLLAAEYEQVVEIAESYIRNLSAIEQAGFWGLNAIDFYQLNK